MSRPLVRKLALEQVLLAFLGIALLTLMSVAMAGGGAGQVPPSAKDQLGKRTTGSVVEEFP